jgi:hypothetical protein
MTRKVLRGANFDSTKALSDAIIGYIDSYNAYAQPFIWMKREVLGQ